MQKHVEERKDISQNKNFNISVLIFDLCMIMRRIQYDGVIMKFYRCIFENL